jgi:hypothetical protein
MANPSSRKLNQLQQLPDSALVDAAWLEHHGYSSSLRSQYVKAGWLTQPAPRVYRRGNGPLPWQHVVISLQAFMASELTVGGRTALEELGYAHYLGQRREVHLYGPHMAPGWLSALPLDVTFHWHNSLRLFPADPELPLFPPPEPDPASLLPGGFLSAAGTMQWGMRLASAERALFQLLDELPDHESFHQVDKLVEGLANLSPRRLQIQLETCRSVKVKRLFFFFADRHRHAWLDGVNKQAVDLGAGKRMLVKGGRLDPTYLITVPGDLDGLS